MGGSLIEAKLLIFAGSQKVICRGFIGEKRGGSIPSVRAVILWMGTKFGNRVLILLSRILWLYISADMLTASFLHIYRQKVGKISPIICREKVKFRANLADNQTGGR
ncbi:MAG: hypothetical protein WC632_02220 [Candidatus Margulisiibacteriota bacterium]